MQRRRAFTLVELLIVIIIIAVLAAIAIPKVAQGARRSKEASLRRGLQIVRSAVDRFYADTGHYPQRLSWLNDYTNEVMPTFPVLTEAGVQISISGTLYKGPYITDSTGNGSFTSQPNPLGGIYTHAALQIPMDPVSRKPFNCVLANGRFNVTSSASGNDSSGVSFSSY